jgi:CHAD domain-containing protein
MKKSEFRIVFSPDPGRDLKGLLEQQLMLVSRHAAALPENPGESIHNIRRAFKRSRAILRLLRDSMGYAAWYRENRNIRDMHRLLSPAREINVFRHTLKHFTGNNTRLPGEKWFLYVAEETRVHQKNVLSALIENNTAEAIRLNVEKSAERIGHYPLSGEGFGSVEKGLARTYRQGRKLTRVVVGTDATPHELHELRKRANNLQHQVTLFRPVFPPVMKAASKALKNLTDLLGEYNDLQQASEKLPALIDDSEAAQRKLEQLLEQIKGEQDELHKKAGHQAQKIYAEPAGQFTARIRTYWEAWAEEQEALEQKNAKQRNMEQNSKEQEAKKQKNVQKKNVQQEAKKQKNVQQENAKQENTKQKNPKQNNKTN